MAARYIASGRPTLRTGSFVVIRNTGFDREGRFREQLTRGARIVRETARDARRADKAATMALQRCEADAYRMETRRVRESAKVAARVERAKQRAYDVAVARVQRADRMAEERRRCGTMAWLADE